MNVSTLPAAMDDQNQSHALTGALSFATVPGLVRQSRAWFSANGPVEVDLSAVTQADSVGIALLIEWLQIAEQNDITLSYTGMGAQLKDLIRANGVDAVFSSK